MRDIAIANRDYFAEQLIRRALSWRLNPPPTSRHVEVAAELMRQSRRDFAYWQSWCDTHTRWAA